MTEPPNVITGDEKPSMTMGRIIALALKGAAMGAANVIPGLSGGTIALITGIYEELIHTLNSFGHVAARLLFKGKIRKAFDHVNGFFICAIGIGLVASWFTLAKLMKHLLANKQSELLTMAFFFGLILASVFTVGQRVQRWFLQDAGLFILGAGLAGGILLIPHSTPITSPFYILLCGTIAMSAMILPGISGSFILLLMGSYLHIITAITRLDLAVLAPFAFGCVIGLLAFSRAISFILKKFYNATLALLTGFVAGSLAVIWPWKEKQFLIDNGEFVLHKGEKIVNGYALLQPVLDSEFYLALLLILAGAGLVPLMELFVSSRTKPDSPLGE